MMDSRQEQQIVSRAARGDADAFARLVEAYQGDVYRLTLRMGLSPADAEEAAQEAFLAAWRALPQFRGESRFSTWLYRLASNAAVDLLRREKRHKAAMDIDETVLPDGGDTPQELSERSERAQAVQKAMAALPPEYRRILLLRYMEQLSYGEIGAALKLPNGTVKSRISRAKAQLKENLQTQGNLFALCAVQTAGKEERT